MTKKISAGLSAQLRYIGRTHDIAQRFADVGIRKCDEDKAVTAIRMAEIVPWSAMRHATEDCAAFDRALGRSA